MQPITGDPVQFAFSTLERWLHLARKAAGHGDTVGALRRKIRSDAGTRRVVSSTVVVAIVAQHKEHPTWSYKLHADNVVALVALGELVGHAPSYTTVRRTMKERGLFRQKRRQRRGNEDTGAHDHSREIFEARETRSYESEYVHGLWHLDFHGAKFVRIVLPNGTVVTPKLLGILDDRSRLCCHAQWYLDETGEALVHGLSQAIQKRRRPQKLLTDYVPRHIIGVEAVGGAHAAQRGEKQSEHVGLALGVVRLERDHVACRVVHQRVNPERPRRAADVERGAVTDVAVKQGAGMLGLPPQPRVPLRTHTEALGCSRRMSSSNARCSGVSSRPRPRSERGRGFNATRPPARYK